MDEDLQAGQLRQAAVRAGRRAFFVAGDLLTYQRLQGIGDDELAAFLGCPPDALPGLALCRKPDTRGADFRAEVEAIAAYAGVNRIRLAELFCEVAAVTALRRANPDPGAGFLLAARDHPGEGEPGPAVPTPDPDPESKP